jgi:hypothetical protein
MYREGTGEYTKQRVSNTESADLKVRQHYYAKLCRQEFFYTFGKLLYRRKTVYT